MLDQKLIYEVSKNLHLKQLTRYILTGLSLAGAILVMQDQTGRMIGFAAWSLSNLGWLVDALARRDAQQSIMYAFFEVTSMVGLLNNI